jgi:hypothetical protein
VIGGRVGTAVRQTSQFGLGTLLLKYSREYEKQADLLGAQMMARAGYDPNDLARMFETIARQSKSSGGIEWLSDHPNPGDRSQYIAAEARMVPVAPRPDRGRDFQAIKTAFAGQPAARSMTDMTARNTATGSAGGGATSAGGVATTGTPGQPVPPPSLRQRIERGGSIFQVAVPDNWRTLSANSFIRYVPENAYGPLNGRTVLTHGVELGVARAASNDLESATATFLDALLRGEPSVQRGGRPRVVSLASRPALATPLLNDSPLGGDERLAVYTTQLADGNLFYVLTVVPGRDEVAYAGTFQNILQSIRLTDRR